MANALRDVNLGGRTRTNVIYVRLICMNLYIDSDLRYNYTLNLLKINLMRKTVILHDFRSKNENKTYLLINNIMIFCLKLDITLSRLFDKFNSHFMLHSR